MTSERAIDVMHHNRMITTWRDIAQVNVFLIASLQHGDELGLLVALKRWCFNPKAVLSTSRGIQRPGLACALN